MANREQATGRPHLWLLILSALVLAALLTYLAIRWQGATPAAGTPARPTARTRRPLYAPGEVLVRYRTDVPQAMALAAARGEGMVHLASLPEAGLLRLGVSAGQEEEAIQRLLDNPLVVYAGPNYLAYATADPNDPMWPRQWDMIRIGMGDVWGEVLANPGLIIAVLDSGIDLHHPDLALSLVPGYDFVHGDSGPDDDFGHGTHVAGIAAAITNNGLGIAGIAGGARIMPCKVLDQNGAGTYYDIIQAIYYARDHGARVINLSLGGAADDPNLRSAVQSARTAGILVVASVGNDDGPPLYPAAYPEVLAVAATDTSDQRAAYSNYGPAVDLAAPGGAPGQGVYSTVPGAKYGEKYGTSMAAPHVSGLAALIWSVAPQMSVTQVERVLVETCAQVGGVAYPGGRNDYLGYGRVNAPAAIRRAREWAGLPTPTPSPIPWPTPTSTPSPPSTATATPAPSPTPTPTAVPGPCATVRQTGSWVTFFGPESRLDGQPLPLGTLVEVFDPQGVRCGCVEVGAAGAYGPLQVYEDDPETPTDEGAARGDYLRFRLNGLPARTLGPDLPYWDNPSSWKEVNLEAESHVTRQLPLSAGWNLVSFPVLLDDARPESLLTEQTDRVRVLLTYACGEGALSFYPDLPPSLNTLRSLDPWHGYWIQTTDPITLTVSGQPVPPGSPLPLCAGWNLASYLPSRPVETRAGFSSLGPRWDVALGYHQQALSYYVALPPALNTLHQLEPGHGYWVHLHTPGTLAYPPTP